LTAGDISGGIFDLIALRNDGSVRRISIGPSNRGWDISESEVARWPGFPAKTEPGSFRIFLADLDNNGALDLIASGSPETRIWLGDVRSGFELLDIPIKDQVFAATSPNDKGLLNLLALSPSGQPILYLNQSKAKQTITG
jgi:hypothetical protein